MDTTIKFGDAPKEFTLQQAILIYRDEKTCAATVHDIEIVRNRPHIKPGQPVTIAGVKALATGLGGKLGGGFLPANVLSVSMDRMAWWCPAGRRRIWFKPSHTDDKKKTDEIKALNGKFVHMPPLLFIAGGSGASSRGLSVFALLSNERPKADTRLWRAPFWNLSEGHMCNGNLELPAISPDSIEGFEKAFFNSAFTHSSAGVLTHHKGGHTGLWQELAQRKTPPDMKYWIRTLVRTQQTVQQILK